MYFTNISYKELQEFHDKVHINVRINLQDTLNNGLFKIVTIGDLLKVFPLFYTDRIESSNSNDKIMENKCVICENKNDTILYFIADETIPVLNLTYNHYSDFTNYLVFYFYDAITGNTIYNVSANFIFKENNETIQENKLNSDKNGIIYLNTRNINYDYLKADFTVNGATKTFEWSSE